MRRFKPKEAPIQIPNISRSRISQVNYFRETVDRQPRRYSSMKLICKIATVLTGVLLGVLVSLISSKVLEKSLFKEQMKLSALDSEPIGGLQQEGDGHHDRIANAILVDSILTIVQNYYVDRERSINNRDLVLGALKELRIATNLKFSVDDRVVRMRVDDKVSDFNIEESYSFQRLLEDSIHISSFLAKTSISESPEYRNIEGGNAGAFIYLNALLKSLDPHSGLLDQEEYRELKQGTEGSFGGLGVVVGIQNDVLTVIKPLPHSPAEKAGISGKDRITFINNVSTFGTSLQSLVHHMRGAPGTEVNLSLLRDGEVAPRNIKIRREVIQVDSIESEVIGSGTSKILSISIDSFSSRTSDEIKEAIHRNRKSDDIKGVILDLRGNPGGLLDQAVKSADLFLEKGRIVSTSGRRPEVEIAYDEGDEITLPLIVLVDSDTASASEILAGALQDNNRAIVLGQPTFGKGSVQTVFELPSNQALKLTIARYYSPSGKMIQNLGIMPDIWVQPVFRSDSNLNLLGLGRYSSEKFLSNSLAGEERNHPQQPRYKYFHLADEKQDYLKILATGIFDDLLEKNGFPLPPERKRATYWLASSSEYIASETSLRDLDVSEYINKQHKIGWKETSPIEDYSMLEMKILSQRSLKIKEGQEVSIEWELINKSSLPVDRVSVFLRSNEPEISTREQLVGKIEPESVYRGETVFRSSLVTDEIPYRVFLGASIEAWPIFASQRYVDIKVEPSEKPDITYELELVEEKGKMNGILEPGESAVIEVTLENGSKTTAHNVNASLVNFSGRQVKLGKVVVRKPVQLDTSETTKFQFPISISQDLKSKNLHFGLTIDAQEYLVPLKNNHILKAVPRRR